MWIICGTDCLAIEPGGGGLDSEGGETDEEVSLVEEVGDSELDEFIRVVYKQSLLTPLP